LQHLSSASYTARHQVQHAVSIVEEEATFIKHGKLRDDVVFHATDCIPEVDTSHGAVEVSQYLSPERRQEMFDSLSRARLVDRATVAGEPQLWLKLPSRSYQRAPSIDSGLDLSLLTRPVEQIAVRVVVIGLEVGEPFEIMVRKGIHQ
jgi:hypothetical protein